MPRDVIQAARDIPAYPDWDWLQSFWVPPMLLQFDVAIDELGPQVAGRLAVLATPYLDYADGPVLAADTAAEWQRALIGHAELPCLSPAINQQIITEMGGIKTGDPSPKPAAILRLAELVVVPPMAGWEVSCEVWHLVCEALTWNKQVYVLARQAGSV